MYTEIAFSPGLIFETGSWNNLYIIVSNLRETA
jgi:hypothetical protein